MVEQLSLVEVDEIAAEIKPPKIEKRTVKERRQQVLTVLTICCILNVEWSV